MVMTGWCGKVLPVCYDIFVCEIFLLGSFIFEGHSLLYKIIEVETYKSLLLIIWELKINQKISTYDKHVGKILMLNALIWIISLMPADILQ